jgi:hypothetical protein
VARGLFQYFRGHYTKKEKIVRQATAVPVEALFYFS